MFAVRDLSPLKGVLESGPVKAFHNSKFDYQFLLAEHGVSLSPLFDTMLAAQLLDGGEYGASYALEAVAERYLDEAVDKSARREDWSGGLSQRQLEYAARDAAILLPLRERLAGKLEEERLGYISVIEFGAVAAIAEMELAGVKLDLARWKELEKTVRERRDRAALAPRRAVLPEPEGSAPSEGLGPRLNLNSPKQITDAFRSLGIELPDTKVWTLLKIDHPAGRAPARVPRAAEEARHLPGDLPELHPPEDRTHPRQLPPVQGTHRAPGVHEPEHPADTARGRVQALLRRRGGLRPRNRRLLADRAADPG